MKRILSILLVLVTFGAFAQDGHIIYNDHSNSKMYGRDVMVRSDGTNLDTLTSLYSGTFAYDTVENRIEYVNNAGSWVGIVGSIGNSLDQAYDSGGAGVGRTIIADNGALKVAGSDGLLVTGTFGSGAVPEISGAGARMFFNPRKAAFRSGEISGTQWDDVNIGYYFIAFGLSTISSGVASTSVGSATIASGDFSTAMGGSTTASGANSTAMGFSTTASGSSSTSIGNTSNASGDVSTAIGSSSTAESFSEVSIGMFNTDYTPTSTSAWSATDRLLVVGNGLNSGSLSDALVILKNGNTGIGISTPSATLDVVGTMQYVDGNEAANYVLTSDASGNASWAISAGDLVRLGNITPTCVLEGGFLTVNGGDGTKFDISAGQGWVVDQFTDPDNPVFTEVSWTAQVALTPAHAATVVSYIAVNSSGTIVQQATEHTIAERRDLIVLGFIGTADGTNVSSTGDESSPAPIGYTGDCLARALDQVNLSGNAYGAASNDLTINRSAGETFKPSINRVNDPKNPNRKIDIADASVTFIYMYNDGSGDPTFVISQTDIDPDQMDDGSGTLTSVSNNRWTNQIMYWFPNSQVALIQYGDEEYLSLAGAKAAVGTLSFLNLLDEDESAAIRTVLSVKKGNSDLSDATTAFTNTGKFGLGGGAGGSGSAAIIFVDNEVVAGVTGTTFTLAFTPVVGSEHVYISGVRGKDGTDYTISGAVITTSGSETAGTVIADYRR